MNKEIERIISSIKNNPSWDKNTIMRYAYLELGKLLHKDSKFFYTIQGNLQGDCKKSFRYTVDEIDTIMNSADRDTYNVICYTTASLLKKVFDSVGIDSTLEINPERQNYIEDGKTVEIKHYFLVAEGNDGKKYALTLNPDLPLIQTGRQTTHFGNIPDGSNIEGLTPFDEKELREIDKKLGYLRYRNGDDGVYPDKDPNNEDEYVYEDVFFDQISELFRKNDTYLNHIASDTRFYYDLIQLLNGKKTYTEILERENDEYRDELDDACFDFSFLTKTKDELEEIREFLFDAIITAVYGRYTDIFENKPLTMEVMNRYLDAWRDKNYRLFPKLFLEDCGCGVKEASKRAGAMKMMSPLLAFSRLGDLFNYLDRFDMTEGEEKVQANKDLWEVFSEDIMLMCLHFVPNDYLPNKELSCSYITHKLIFSLKRVFDIGCVSDFNKLGLAEQIAIVKNVVNSVFAKENPKRVLQCVIFDNKTQKPYYLLQAIKANEEDGGSIPIIFDMENNKLITELTVTDILSRFTIAKNIDLTLAIEGKLEKGKTLFKEKGDIKKEVV